MANSKESYNDVELSSEELGSLEGQGTTTSQETPKEETQENSVNDANASNEADSRATNPEGSSDYEYQLEMDGETYSVDDIEQWKKDSDNKSNWNKTNTEKAQGIAGVGKFLKKFQGDEGLRTHLKEYFKDEKEFESFNLNSTISDVEEQVEGTPFEERLNRLEQFENNRVVDQRTDNLQEELSSLENQYPNVLGTPEKVMDFLNFSERNSARYRDNNGVIKLSDVFREYSYDALNEELSHFKKLNDNKNTNDGSVVNRSEIGAKDVQTPKHIQSWKDIDPHDEDFKQYFDE